ncbi:rCG33237 [Rattus norvegicus]|uniref:RCG33237 n=1 Tax=Rattus norvegicus TaxID=10116 RepID=A6HDI8_RAT|nr:rCG33237 [Rattus norvegicus]
MCYFSVKLAQKIKWEMCFALFYVVYIITQLICILYLITHFSFGLTTFQLSQPHVQFF